MLPPRERGWPRSLFLTRAIPENLHNRHIGRPIPSCQSTHPPRAALPPVRRAGLLLTPNCQRLFARSRHTEFTTRSLESCERLRKSEWRRAWNPAFGSASSRRAAAQVRQVVHAQTLGDFPATGLGWRRRNGPATGPRPASATAPASSRRCSPAARTPRPAHRRSRLCPRGTTARFTPPGAGNCPARILRASNQPRAKSGPSRTSRCK